MIAGMGPQSDPDRSPDNTTSNTVTGGVSGNAVQAETIQGGVHFHGTAGHTTPTWPYRAGVVPQRAGCFQNRAIAQLLTRAVDNGDTAILTGDIEHTSVLSGLGGVGKTQLAVDYAEHLWQTGQLDLLVWITAGSRDAIITDYAQLAEDLTGTPDADPEGAARRALSWLATTGIRWLMVLDDVQAPADLRGLWPPTTPTGRVVVTTRRRDHALTGHQRRLIPIGLFTPEESHAYLTEALIDHPHLADGADALAEDLGHLPIALAQAAAYMVDRELSCVDYRHRWADLRRSLASLVPDADGLPDEHRDTIAATWSLSIEQADQLPPVGVARPLLALASLLDPNNIPTALFTTPAVLDYLTTAAGRDITPDDTHDGLGCLHRLNLITLDHQTMRVHALVQRATRDHLTLTTATLTTLVGGLPEHSQILRDTSLALTQALVTRHRDTVAQDPSADHADLAGSLNNLSLRLSDVGRPEDGLTAITEAVQLYRELATTQPDAFLPDLAMSLNNLSLRLSDVGRPEDGLTAITEAVQLYRELATTQPDAFLPDLAMSLNNLSVRLGELDRRDDGLAAITEAVQIRRILAATQPDAFLPDVATSLNNLSVELAEVGRPEDGLTAITEAVQIRRILAATQPDAFLPNLATSLNNLANRLGAVGRHEDGLTAITEAVQLYRELATARPDAFLPDLAGSLNNLAIRLGALGRHQHGLTAITEAVHIRRELAAARPAVHQAELDRSLRVAARLSETNNDRAPDDQPDRS
jgi:hypothetical protein